ncbi:MAG: zinc-binding dehydrogenase [Clostridiales bacterium]|jgi:L-gulonate 5-dehydrogenase|nr:zinc-binding dehydrogenase [Clostridiales bacterium]
MKAWRIYGAGDVRLDEMKSEPVGEGCVKLKITHSSVSLTDRLIYGGVMQTAKSPLTLGRTCVAMVTEAGEGVQSLGRGDLVVVPPYSGCGVCSACKSGRFGDCIQMLTYGVDEDGLLRDFAVVPQIDAVKLPDRVNAEDAVFTEHIAIAIAAMQRLNLEKGEHVVIAGANVIGIILAQIAIYYQMVPVIIDERAERLELAERLGVYYTVNNVQEDVKQRVFSITGGRMADAVVHLASAAQPLAKSLEYAKKGGRAVVVGWNGVAVDLNVPLNTMLFRQLTIEGVNNGARSVKSAINMLAQKSVAVAPMISKQIGFDAVGAALAESAALPDKYMKIVVKL